MNGRRRALALPILGLALVALCGCSTPRPRSGEAAASPPPTTPGGAVTAVAAAPLAPAAAHLPPPQPVSAPAPGVATVRRATIAAVGDVLMHGAVKEAAAEHRTPGNDGGYGWLWAPVADLLAGADLTFANLETPVAPRADQGSRSFVFNVGPSLVAALRHAGVDLVSVANNHIFDQGRPGFEETLSALEAEGMAFVGAGPAGREAGPRLVEVNGLRIAFLGYARFFNQSGNDCPAGKPDRPCLRASLLDPERAVADVRAAAGVADAVVVSLHWGEEYQPQPRQADVTLAHRLADAGAVLVLGHHPHVLQPLELYARPDGSTSLIAYSLGNFVSNQSRLYQHGVTPPQVAATRDGVLLRAEIARRDYGRGVSRVELAAAGWLPLWTENDTADPERRASGRRPSIQVVSLDRALAQVRTELAALPDPVPAADAARYVKLRRREELYLARRAAMASVLGEDLEQEAPPPSPIPAARATGERPPEPARAAVGAERRAVSPPSP